MSNIGMNTTNIKASTSAAAKLLIAQIVSAVTLKRLVIGIIESSVNDMSEFLCSDVRAALTKALDTPVVADGDLILSTSPQCPGQASLLFLQW